VLAVVLLAVGLAGALLRPRARRAGVDIDARLYSRVGAVVGLPAMLSAALVLRVLG